MGYGNESNFAFAAQDSASAVASGFTGLPIMSETLEHSIEEAREGDFTRFGWLEPPIQPGKSAVQGGIEFEPYPEVFGHLAKAFFGVSSGLAVGSVFTHDFYAGGDVADFDTTVAMPPYTLYAFRGVGSAWLISDIQVTELGLSQEPGGYLKGSMSVIGRGITVENPHVITYEGNEPWLWDQGSVSFAGAGLGTLESFELSMANKVEGVDTLNLSKFWGQSKRTDYFEVTFNGTMEFSDYSQYETFASNSWFPVVITFEQPTEIGSGYGSGLKIDIPQFRYTTFPPQISGPGRTVVSFTGRGIADATSSYSVQLTLTNTAGVSPY